MAVSLSLLLIDILSLSVYIDLYLVYRYQRHLFTPLMPYLGSRFKSLYRTSLQRNFFCVSDKVEVSGTTFTVIFAGVYIASLIWNLFELGSRNFLFYLIGLPYLAYVLFCMHFYKTVRELCFYCKYTLVQNLILLVAMATWFLDQVPTGYLVLSLVCLIGSLVGRGLARKQRAKELRRREAAP